MGKWQSLFPYLLFVASRTTRKAFWLLSNGSHLCALNAVIISATASGSVSGMREPNSEPHRSQTAISTGVFFTIRSPCFGIGFGMGQVYRAVGNPSALWMAMMHIVLMISALLLSVMAGVILFCFAVARWEAHKCRKR